MGNVLLTAYVVYSKFLTGYATLGVSVDTTSPASKGAALLYYVEPLLYHDEFSGAQVLWLDPTDQLTQPLVLCQSASLVGSAVAPIEPSDGFELELSRSQPALPTPYLELGPAPLDPRPSAPTPLIVLDIPNSDLSLYTLALGALSFNPGMPSIISYVNSPAGIKSYTMRSRQFYRSGVLWCLALTALAVLGPQYLFYGFTFLFSYWWALAALLVLRSLGLTLWRLLPIATKFRIKNFYSVL